MARRHIAALATTVALAAASLLAAPAAGATTPATCASPGEKVSDGDFELGKWGPWTMSVYGVPGSIHEPLYHDEDGTHYAHSGIWFTFFGGVGGIYPDWTDFLEQTVTVPAGCHATLTYWLHAETDETGSTANDFFTVNLGGTRLATFSNLDAAPGYQQHTVDVSSFAGQTVTLRFDGTEDAAVVSTFFLDDIGLNAS